MNPLCIYRFFFAATLALTFACDGETSPESGITTGVVPDATFVAPGSDAALTGVVATDGLGVQSALADAEAGQADGASSGSTAVAGGEPDATVIPEASTDAPTAEAIDDASRASDASVQKDASDGSATLDAAGPTDGGTIDATRDITIWIAGDSTVCRVFTPPCPVGWGAEFQPYFNQHITIVNNALGGRSVSNWMYKIPYTPGEYYAPDSTGECPLERDLTGEPIVEDRWQQMLDEMQQGDYLFVQFGINDSNRLCPMHVGTEAFISYYGIMAEAATARGTRPVFVTPVSPLVCQDETAIGMRGTYTDATFEAGQRFHVPVIDLNKLSNDLYNELGLCPVPQDFFCGEDERLHFSQAGAVHIAQLVAEALREQAIGLAVYLK